MANVNDLLEAAANADRAGDSAAAQMLVREAERMMAQPQPGPQAPPRADAPGGGETQRRDRFGDTIAYATEGPIASTKAFAAGLADQSKSPTMQALPEWTPGPLKRPLAAVGDVAMTGLSGLGTVLAGGAGAIGEVFGGTPTNERKLAGDIMGAMEVAVPELAGVSSTTRMASGVAKASARAENLTDAQKGARAASDLGITPSLGMTGKTAAMGAAALEKVPFAGSVIARDAARAVGEVESAFQKIKAGIGQSFAPSSAGEAMQTSLLKSVGKFKERSAQLFAKVDDRMPKDTAVAIDNAQEAVTSAKEHFATNPNLAAKLGLNEWDAVMSEAKKNGVNWQAVKQLRSKIGEAIGSNRGALADEDLGRLKTLYGALTADMEAATKAAGNGAFGAWKAANNYYKHGASRIERSLDGLIKDGVSPERAFEAFSNMTRKDRATSDIQRMREIKASMDDGAWGTVSASIVDRLGKARAGVQNADGEVFSPGTFLTEWNKLSREAKTILLPEDTRVELDKLAKVSERLKSAGLERNMSNTGTVVTAATVATSLTQAPKLTLATLAAANLTARAMTSQTFLKALNSAARGEAKTISAMAKGKGPFALDAREVLRLMAAENVASPSNEQSAPMAIAN